MESSNLISESKKEKNKIKSNDLFHNLKSDNFLQKVFNYLETKKHLIF